MATKVKFDNHQVNVSTRIVPDSGDIKRTNQPVNIKTTTARPSVGDPRHKE